MENTLNKHSLAKATRLLEVLYLPESRKLIKMMESSDSLEKIDLLIQTGWQEERLNKHLHLLEQVGAIKPCYAGKNGYWNQIVGTRGFKGKNITNSNTQFNVLFSFEQSEVDQQTDDSVQLDNTKLDQLEQDQT